VLISSCYLYRISHCVRLFRKAYRDTLRDWSTEKEMLEHLLMSKWQMKVIFVRVSGRWRSFLLELDTGVFHQIYSEYLCGVKFSFFINHIMVCRDWILWFKKCYVFKYTYINKYYIPWRT
jgi:hypothetical protein